MGPAADSDACLLELSKAGEKGACFQDIQDGRDLHIGLEIEWKWCVGTCVL